MPKNGPDFTFYYDGKTELTITALDIKTYSDIDDLEEGIEIFADETRSGSVWEFKIASTANWPEFKTETCYKWVKIPLDGKTKIPYPCAYRRTCKKTWYARVVYSGPTGDLPKDFKKILEECAKIAIVPAIPLILAGQVPAAIAAFLGTLKRCLIAKSLEKIAGKITVGIYSRKSCGNWKKV